MKTLKKVTMSNIRHYLLPCRFRFMQNFNCYNAVNIAVRLTKMLPAHSAAHCASIRVKFWLLCASVKTFSISPMCVVSLDGSFVSRSALIFVIVAVHIQYSKLFKGMECTLLYMVLCTIKNSLSYRNKSVA